MSCLHIVNSYLSQDQWQMLEDTCGEEDALLLIEDGVYLIKSHPIQNSPSSIFVHGTDALTRGIIPPKTDHRWLADYDAMVDLVMAYDKTLTWTYP